MQALVCMPYFICKKRKIIMFKIALVGLGGMGRGHFAQLQQLAANYPDIELVALCDINPKKFGDTNQTIAGTESAGGAASQDFSKYHIYYDVDEMLAKEELDMVDVVVPTYEHSTVACKVMNKGIHCFCEKPMALSISQCNLMIETAKKNNVLLMLGLCLRFDNTTMTLKDFFTTGRFGAPLGGLFFRYAALPGSEWYHCREKSGGALLDFHVHDVDVINWYYGMPKAVSTLGKIVYPGSGYDIVYTNYIYDEKYAVHAEATWANSEFPFAEGYRADFELGTVFCDKNGLRAIRRDTHEPIELKALTTTNCYYNELEYFVNCVREGTENTINPPEASLEAVRIALAEMKSADLNGMIVEV